ncbi:MAG: tetratricopeptide repeat protein [Gammaproteobacteria bacterium]|nr:tetratricopeptide repeat protein [Gammaproteobacteria bacterium]
MNKLNIIASGLLLAAGASAATLEEAAELFTAQKWEAAAVAYQDIVKKTPANAFALFRLARAQAAKGDESAALATMQAWIGAGGGNYQAAMTVPELQTLRGDPRFAALVDPLRPCAAPEYHQFDFWLGDWNVETPAAAGVVSHNRISSINGGCALHEQYTTPSGYEGSSLNFYDSARKVWHQTWIDNQGGPLYIEGGFDGKSMVLATTADPKQVNRVTWTPLDDGRVRQHWESSSDGGATWSTAFDGYYSRR